MRYKLLIEYDGTRLAGWQAQTGLLTAQGLIENALAQIGQEAIAVYGAGRTDAGVHATGQVAHFQSARPYTPEVWFRALNYYLKSSPVSIVAVTSVPPSFHARFSALGKLYRYRILNRIPPSSLRRRFTWHLPWTLDLSAMQRAAELLVGHHNFNGFRASACQTLSPVKTLQQLEVTRREEEIHIQTYARSFLHNQVRIIVGSLAWVGTGKLNLAAIKHALVNGDRTKVGPTAPAQGLTLVRVDYPPKTGSNEIKDNLPLE